MVVFILPQKEFVYTKFFTGSDKVFYTVFYAILNLLNFLFGNLKIAFIQQALINSFLLTITLNFNDYIFKKSAKCKISHSSFVLKWLIFWLFNYWKHSKPSAYGIFREKEKELQFYQNYNSFMVRLTHLNPNILYLQYLQFLIPLYD